MKLHFLGAAHEVTGSCTLLEAAGKRILVDCGMEQGADIYLNCSMPIAAGDVDYVLLTHAHIDHSGKLPELVHNGYKGRIYATEATTKLCAIMLMDSAHIQESEAEWRNRKALRSGGDAYVPLYTIDDVQKTLPLFTPCRYGDPVALDNHIQIAFSDAGHLLGSSSIRITVEEDGKTESILFSGDLGNVDRPIIRDPQAPDPAEYVVIESTYGNRLHGERSDYMTQLTKIVQETFDAGGNLVIPSFAVGRTQELLYLFREMKEKKLIHGHGNFSVWVDSPLAIEATQIYNDRDLMGYYDDATLQLIHDGINVLGFDGLKVSVTSQDSIAINQDPTPKVILSASGMCEAGRIRHHLKHNLWRRESTILFVGYQAEGTLGRKVIEGAKHVKLFGEDVAVNARIETMKGISGHADRDMLLNWLSHQSAPKMVFVNHGNDEVCDEFAQTIHERCGFPAEAPYNGAIYDLQTMTCLDGGNAVRIVREKPKASHNKMVFDKLMAAGRRLMSVIERSREKSNKDISRFTAQIEQLCDKWDD